MHDCYLQAYKILACSTREAASLYGTVLMNYFKVVHASSDAGI